jgi:putative ABC transport system permease protein
MHVVETIRTAAFLAVRALVRGPLGVLVMTIAMMSLVYVQLLFIPSLIQGAIDQVESQLIDTTTSSVQISPGPDDKVIVDASGVVASARDVSDVDAATAVLRVGSEVSSGTISGTWPVLAIEPDSYGEVFTTPSNLIDGDWLAAGDRDGIVLGIGIAGVGDTSRTTYRSSLRSVQVGDEVDVTLMDGTQATFTVRGIYRNNFEPSDSSAFITQDAAVALLPNTDDIATSISIRTVRGDEHTVVERLQEQHGNLGYETWLDLRVVIDSQTESFDLIKQILRVVSLLVAAVTVTIVTYVDLVGKRRTIGIERAIGIRSNAIVWSYVLKAVAYALAGTAVGITLYLGVVVPLIDRYPFSFPNGDVTLSVSRSQLRSDAAILIVVAVASALLPALRTVRVRILDAIWR